MAPAGIAALHPPEFLHQDRSTFAQGSIIKPTPACGACFATFL
jgi:hypothetical protein